VGVADLAEASGAQVHMPEGERELLESPSAFSPPSIGLRAYVPDVLLAGGETIEAAGMSFEVVSVPGHSPAHIAYYADGALFSGDVLFAGSVGRTDLPGADWETLVASIATLMDRYPPETAVYAGHGPATTLGAELARNPFLADLRASRSSS
jgi:glyoxylase-like metal-dependent hydrolase (beta-lactamase superfamily II)